MKKTILAIVLLAILGGLGYYLIRTYGPADPSRYLPDNTIAYAAFTDLPRSARRWQDTELSKIANEPSVRDFLKVPLEKLGEAGKNEAEAILRDIKPSRMFGAITSIGSTQISWVGGFQYYGSHKSLQHALDRLRQQFDAGHPAIEHTVSQYEGVEITKTQHGELTLFTTSKGVWCVLSNDEKTIHDTLDRLAGRNTSPALVKNAEFQKGLDQLPKEADFVSFVNASPILETLLAVGKTMNAIPNPYQLEQIRKIKSLTASFKIDGPLLRDSCFIQTDETPSGKFEHRTVQYTSPDTLLYYSSLAKWPNMKDNMNSFIPPNIYHILVEQHLDSVNLSEIFGPEIGFSLSWPQASFTPEVLIAIPLVNSDAAKKLIETVSASVLPQMVVTEDANAHYYSAPSVNGIAIINPTLAITRDFLLFGMSDTAVHASAAKTPDSPNLESSADFQSIKSIYQDANEAFGYIDSKRVFERTYNALKPVISFGTALMPMIGQYVDTSKLPDSSAITSHLTPITIYQRRVQGGVYMESAGPLTLNQLLLVGGGAGWFFSPKH
ncbi:MAG: DUF3352 domain-containing protein [Chthoniobacterales bacterium]